MAQLHGDVVGQALGIAYCGTLPGELFQPLLRRQPVFGFLGWITVGEFIERKGAASGYFHGAGERLGIALEQPRHFFRWFQETVGVPFL